MPRKENGYCEGLSCVYNSRESLICFLSMEKEERQLLVEKFALKDSNLAGFFTVERFSCSCSEEAKAAKVFEWKFMYL